MSAGAAEDVILLVADRAQLPPAVLVARQPADRRTARARAVAMYLCHVGLGLPKAVVGRAFGRHRVTVHCAIAHIEDYRDDPKFDAELTALEERLTPANPRQEKA